MTTLMVSTNIHKQRL